MAILMLSFAFASVTAAAGSITLTPTTQTTGGSVTVAGTGFGATQAVGIGLGQEITVTNETITTFSGTADGPYLATLAHYPIKPGSFSMHWDTSGTGSDWTDNGDGTLSSTSSYSAGGIVNYVTGVFGRTSTIDISSYTLTATCSYTYYQYKVTPAANVTTSASGTFTASITVPAALASGSYSVTAVDAIGNKGVATLTVGNAVPESLTFSLVALLSSVAVVASYFLKRPKTADSKYTKL